MNRRSFSSCRCQASYPSDSDRHVSPFSLHRSPFVSPPPEAQARSRQGRLSKSGGPKRPACRSTGSLGMKPPLAPAPRQHQELGASAAAAGGTVTLHRRVCEPPRCVGVRLSATAQGDVRFEADTELMSTRCGRDLNLWLAPRRPRGPGCGRF